ncbi:hypothetical protein M2260_002641 [Rhodococcus erythropolis]|nr:hypothetical protein [Rhodococcus erythropolis]
MELVTELVARAAGAGSGGVATLDHEAVDDAVEDGTVVERAGLGAGGVCGGVLLRAVGEADEVLDGLRRMVAEQSDLDVAAVRVQRCGCGLMS